MEIRKNHDHANRKNVLDARARVEQRRLLDLAHLPLHLEHGLAERRAREEQRFLELLA